MAYDLVALTEAGFNIGELEFLIEQYRVSLNLLEQVYQASGLLSDIADRFKRERRVYFYFNILNYSERRIDFKVDKQNLNVKFWQMILRLDEFSKFVTSEEKERLLSKVDGLKDVDITEESVYETILAFVQNQGSMLMSALEGLFDKVVSHSLQEFKKNIHYVSGWKTNNGSQISKKIILPIDYFYGIDPYVSEYNRLISDVRNIVEDFVKVFGLVSAQSAGDWVFDEDKFTFENNFMRFKVFAKGTIHIWFKDLESLARLNFLVGQNKGWLPTDEEMASSSQAREFVRNTIKDLPVDIQARIG